MVVANNASYYFQYSTDIPSYTRDEEGNPVISSLDDRSIDFVDKMIEIYKMPGSVHHLEGKKDLQRFVDGKTLFLPYHLAASFESSVRAMTTDFGIIPYPKLDETQSEYISFIHSCSSDAAVPTTNTRMEATTATLEAICAEGYRSVTEKFYETSLKTKYVRDDVSSQIIDMIRDSATKNFMAEYGIGYSLFYSVESLSSNAASSFEKSLKSAQKTLDKLTSWDGWKEN